MLFLDSSSCSVWLSEVDTQEAPYSRGLPPGVGYLQFALSDLENGSVIGDIYRYFDLHEGGLVQVTDWARYDDALRDPALAALANQFPSETRKLSSMSRSGVLFDGEESEELLECCSAVVDHGMSAYLYVPGRVTLYLWEGALVDCWSRDQRFFRQFAEWIEDKGLRVTGEKAG
jgi:hypothetical protein